MNQHIYKKRFGQHFLHDHDVLERIIYSISPKATDSFVEIGPGLGVLTKEILPLVKQLTAVEIDRTLIEPLQKKFARFSEFNIINQDILKTDLTSIYPHPFRLIGNIPYNISTPILFHCLKFKEQVQDCFFMMQKEVADRMAANPGVKKYGRLSISIQYYATVEKLFDVSPASFTPPPKVTSSFVRLQFREFKTKAINEKHFLTIVKQAFSYRRKTLHNSLKGFIDDSTYQICNIDKSLRAEKLSIDDFICLSNEQQK